MVGSHVCAYAVCLPTVCLGAFLSVLVCVCEFVFDRCTHWQGFKEVLLLCLSLACPVEYREL